MVLVGIAAGLIMLEPDLGTTIVVVLTTGTLVFVAGASLTHLAAFGGIGGIAASMLILTGEYRADRIFAFVSAEDDPSGRGFQTLQLLIALGSGGVHGLGLGASRQKFFYVPGAHTDGIFAIIGEELGFIGCAVGPAAVRAADGARLPRDLPGARRLRLAAGGRHRLVDRLPDADQHRRHHADAAADGHPAAVPELRRIGAAGDAGGRRASC